MQWLDENGRGSSEGQRFDKMPRALSLSYRPESNRHNVRVPNLNLCLKSCNSETRMRDKKLENGGRRRLAEVVDSQSVLGRSKNALLSNKSRFVDSLKLDLRTNDDMQSSRIIRPLGHGDFWQAAGMLEGKSKSFVLPDRNMNRSTPQIGPRSSRSTRLEDLSSFLPTMPSSRNHRHHRIPPSSSTSSSSSSSTTHIMLPTPTSNAKTSPSRVRGWHKNRPIVVCTILYFFSPFSLYLRAEKMPAIFSVFVRAIDFGFHSLGFFHGFMSVEPMRN